MTRNKRPQFMSLEVTISFIDQVLALKGIRPRTWALATRVRAKALKMREGIGSVKSEGASRDLLKRYDKVNEIIDGPLQLDVYLNTVLVVVQQQVDTVPACVRADWDELFDLLQDIYNVIDPELAESESMRTGTELGEQVWLALS